MPHWKELRVNSASDMVVQVQALESADLIIIYFYQILLWAETNTNFQMVQDTWGRVIFNRYYSFACISNPARQQTGNSDTIRE